MTTEVGNGMNAAGGGEPDHLVLEAGGDPPPTAVLDVAAELLRAGRVVGIPTDTVYGLAVDPRQRGAVDRVYELKGRPGDVPLPVLVADVEAVDAMCRPIPDLARHLMERFWPGGLTLVLPRTDRADPARTVGVRCPDHAVARALCRLIGPLATTSANRHGEPPATQAAAVADLPGVSLVLDAGRCEGQPSTVVDCSRAGAPRLLRAGHVPWAQILDALDAAERPGHGDAGNSRA